jgi:hypothetical protein
MTGIAADIAFKQHEEKALLQYRSQRKIDQSQNRQNLSHLTDPDSEQILDKEEP